MCDLHNQWLVFDLAPQSITYTWTNYCRSRNSSHALQLALPKPLQKFVPRTSPTIFTGVSRRIFSVGIINRTSMRTGKLLLSCRGSGLKSGPPPFSMQIDIAGMSLGRVSFFPWSETQLDCSSLSKSGTVIGQPNGYRLEATASTEV